MNGNLKARVRALHHGERDPGDGPVVYDVPLPQLDEGESVHLSGPMGPRLDRRYEAMGFAEGQMEIGGFWQVDPLGRLVNTGT